MTGTLQALAKAFSEIPEDAKQHNQAWLSNLARLRAEQIGRIEATEQSLNAARLVASIEAFRNRHYPFIL